MATLCQQKQTMFGPMYAAFGPKRSAEDKGSMLCCVVLNLLKMRGKQINN